MLVVGVILKVHVASGKSLLHSNILALPPALCWILLIVILLSLEYPLYPHVPSKFSLLVPICESHYLYQFVLFAICPFSLFNAHF